MAVVREGGVAQLIARIADDPAGDALIHDLARAGVGHVATLRHPPTPDAQAVDAADLGLALRYLPETGVIVLVEPVDPDVVGVAAEASSWSRAPLLLVLAHGSAVPDGIPDEATVLEGPSSDPDGAFASIVASFAVALDRGEDPAAAFQATAAARGAEGTRRSLA